MNGGKATIENGAILSELAHRYIHSLPRNQEEIINDYIREWKKRHYKKCKISIGEITDSKFKIRFTEIRVTNKIKVKPLNRARIKQETRQAYQSYLNERGD